MSGEDFFTPGETEERKARELLDNSRGHEVAKLNAARSAAYSNLALIELLKANPQATAEAIRKAFAEAFIQVRPVMDAYVNAFTALFRNTETQVKALTEALERNTVAIEAPYPVTGIPMPPVNCNATRQAALHTTGHVHRCRLRLNAIGEHTNGSVLNGSAHICGTCGETFTVVSMSEVPQCPVRIAHESGVVVRCNRPAGHLNRTGSDQWRMHRVWIHPPGQGIPTPDCKEYFEDDDDRIIEGSRPVEKPAESPAERLGDIEPLGKPGPGVSGEMGPVSGAFRKPTTVPEALEALRDWVKALGDAQAWRDRLIRELMATTCPRADIAEAAGLKVARIYQINNDALETAEPVQKLSEPLGVSRPTPEGVSALSVDAGHPGTTIQDAARMAGITYEDLEAAYDALRDQPDGPLSPAQRHAATNAARRILKALHILEGRPAASVVGTTTEPVPAKLPDARDAFPWPPRTPAEVAQVLTVVAAGRNAYVTSGSTPSMQTLADEVNTLRNAAVIAQGDADAVAAVKALMPSWLWPAALDKDRPNIPVEPVEETETTTEWWELPHGTIVRETGKDQPRDWQLVDHKPGGDVWLLHWSDEYGACRSADSNRRHDIGIDGTAYTVVAGPGHAVTDTPEAGEHLDPDTVLGSPDERPAPPPCPRDTDGDGNCGENLCPICGTYLHARVTPPAPLTVKALRLAVADPGAFVKRAMVSIVSDGTPESVSSWSARAVAALLAHHGIHVESDERQ